jgi:hypothetical protein
MRGRGHVFRPIDPGHGDAAADARWPRSTPSPMIRQTCDGRLTATYPQVASRSLSCRPRALWRWTLSILVILSISETPPPVADLRDRQDPPQY